MKKNRVYTVSSLLAWIGRDCKFWLVVLPAMAMLAQAPVAYANAEIRLIDGLKLRGVLGADVINDMRSTRNLGVAYYLNEDATEPRPVKDTG